MSDNHDNTNTQEQAAPVVSREKARYWTGVLYPENMPPGWEDDIDDILQLPYVYCIHNADQDSRGDDRKEHVHIIIAFPNTTTYRHALETFNRLSVNGKKACNTCQSVIGVRHMYDYLIHDTDKARKAGKRLYDKSARICGNGFDIGLYEQLSAADKQTIRTELADLIIKMDFTNYADFYEAVASEADENKLTVAVESSGFFERLTRGNYLRHPREK